MNLLHSKDFTVIVIFQKTSLFTIKKEVVIVKKN